MFPCLEVWTQAVIGRHMDLNGLFRRQLVRDETSFSGLLSCVLMPRTVRSPVSGLDGTSSQHKHANDLVEKDSSQGQNQENR
jgi:hypothetical protein